MSEASDQDTQFLIRDLRILVEVLNEQSLKFEQHIRELQLQLERRPKEMTRVSMRDFFKKQCPSLTAKQIDQLTNVRDSFSGPSKTKRRTRSSS